MQSPLYFMALVGAATGIWLLWDVALKGLFLDAQRERIFELRFKLFELGMRGEVSFDSEAYRTLETLLCGLLRFGHRFTFLTFILSIMEQERTKKDKDYADFTNQLELKISRESETAQVKLREILKSVNTAVVVYTSVSSLIFLSCAMIFGMLRAMHLVDQSGRRIVSSVIERDAYMEESRRPRLVAA